MFVALGMTATSLGSALQDNRATLDKVAGAVIIALGVFFLLTPFVPRLNREWRPDALISRAGSGGPLIAGAAFAFAWTPCVGPTLGSILTAAAASDTVGKGGVLLLFYSLGLAVPFLLTAVAFTRATDAFRWLRDRYLIVTAVSGVVLIAMGVLLFTGELTRLNIEAQQRARLDRPELLRVVLSPVVWTAGLPGASGGRPRGISATASGTITRLGPRPRPTRWRPWPRSTASARPRPRCQGRGVRRVAAASTVSPTAPAPDLAQLSGAQWVTIASCRTTRASHDARRR